MKYRQIKACRSEISVEKMCEILNVSGSGYYGWLKRRSSHRAKEDKKLTEEIHKIFQENRETYGSPRITRELRENGIRIGENRVARLMREGNMRAQNGRKSTPQTTDSNHKLPVVPDRIQQGFLVNSANQKWVSDITHIRVGSGWGYLCVIQDLFHSIVKWWDGRLRVTCEQI